MTAQQEMEMQSDHQVMEEAALRRALRAALRREPTPREINRAALAYFETGRTP